MNKKILSLLFASTLILVACGGDNAELKDQIETTDDDEEIVSEETDNENEVLDAYFDDGYCEYDIKEIEQIEGKNDTAILAVEYEYTNNTDEALSPWSADGFAAFQENEDTEEVLDGAVKKIPEDYKPDLVEMFDTDIEPGETVDVVETFEIKYPGSKVILKDSDVEKGKLLEKIVDTHE